MTGHSPEAGATGYSDSDDQPLDVVFDLLANQRRRYALVCLGNNTQPIALTDLAEDVAVRETKRPFIEIPKETVRTILTSLYHIHIPKLVEEGVIEYEQDRDLVRVSESMDLVERILTLAAVGEEE